MSGEKKHWRLSTPFGRFSGKQDSQVKSKVGQSRSRVSSVYLSNDTSTSGFIVVPEFDVPARTQTAREESNHVSAPPLPKLPAVTSSDPLSPNGVDGRLYDLEPIGFHYSSYFGGGSCSTSVPNTSRNDDLSQRLGSAYEHIRSMPSAASSKVSLSSDPRMLRMQLGVPQHSVLNCPVRSSPDLPNPHTSSPKLPPPTSPNVSHARTPKKLGLCTNTNECPISHHRRPPIPPAKRKSVATVLVPTQSCPSECHAPDAPRNGRLACTPKPQPSIPNTPRPARCPVESPIISPHPTPPSRRQCVLRKPAPNTPPSTNARRRQISLPQIRPPSPFNVDIPLHHSWHDRRVKFNSSPEYTKTGQLHETKSRRTSGCTEILASLAWIGTSPVASNSYITRGRHPPANASFFSDIFGMTIAVEDDSISDDALVDRLEKVRRVGGPSTCGRDVPPSASPDNAYFSRAGGDENGSSITCHLSALPPTPDQLAGSRDALPSPPLTTQDTTLDSEDAEVWQAARKTLLCVREIVLTERKYHEALKMLLTAQTATPPPPSMVPHVSALVRASEILLRNFLEDPSAWGVSTAFVTSEDELEATMVSWCAVAGVFFTDEEDSEPHSGGLVGKWRHRRSGMMSSPSSSITKRTSVSLSPRLPPLLPTISTSSKIKKRIDEEHGGRQHPPTEQERQKASLPLQKPENTNSQTLTGRPPTRRPSVRDLAIQPIQRVMRYVLLYRDLLDCTPPTSPPRLLVERALEAATRIANHCDSAQRNPAFSHPP